MGTHAGLALWPPTLRRDAMNEPCQVEWCDRPVVEGHICMACTTRLERALGDVPALWDELDIVLTRQARYNATEGRPGAETALAFNQRASDTGTALRNILNTWCRLIGDERGRQLPHDDHPATVAKWLLHHVPWIRHHRAGADCVEEILSVVNDTRRLVDRPAPRVYAGPCTECGGGMYAKPDAAVVWCRACGLEHSPTDMWLWMWQESQDKLVTAREAVILLGRMGYQIPQKTIEKWKHRGRLTDRGHRDEILVYRFGDVRDLVVKDTPVDQQSA
jgi:hypothetical protein